MGPYVTAGMTSLPGLPAMLDGRGYLAGVATRRAAGLLLSRWRRWLQSW